jgi:hypothetical protein
MIKTYLAYWKPAAQPADADPYVARVHLPPNLKPALARTFAGFEPEVSLAVLPTAQSETPVPPRSATEILAQETGARSPCAAPDAEPFRCREARASSAPPSR